MRVILLFPYLLVAWSIWHLKSLLEREAPFSEVSPGLYVGRRPRHAGEVPKDARVVVDLTSEFDRSPLTLGIARYHCLPTLDTAAPDVDALRAFVIALEGEERPLFIHCAMGHGRSATVAGALIVRAGLAASATEARTLMRLARPRIYLHPVQVQVIDALREHAPRVDTEAAAR